MAVRMSGRMAWVLVVALLAGACGGGDGSTGEASAPPAAAEQSSAIPSEAMTDAGSADGGATDSRTYIVESGDTLSEIARRFDTTVAAIVRANDISDPDVIDVGQELEIPSG